MKALIQRVSDARIVVDDQCIASLSFGILAYIGIGHDDTPSSAERLIDKILTHRIFANAAGKLDLSLLDLQTPSTGGELLSSDSSEGQRPSTGLMLVSQFTLMADTKKGRRPDFTAAMPPEPARVLFDALVSYARQQHPYVVTGQFGADMHITATNLGPINLMLEVV